MKQENKIYPKPMYKYEIAELYGISKDTLFGTWIKKSNEVLQLLEKYYYKSKSC